MDALFLIGRILFGVLFLLNGYGHLAELGGRTQYAKAKGVPAPAFAVAMTGLMLILGSLSILLGAYTDVGLILIIAFLLPVTLKMHAFWSIEDPGMKMAEQINFTKNMALLGAALMLFHVPKPWPFSLF